MRSHKKSPQTRQIITVAPPNPSNPKILANPNSDTPHYSLKKTPGTKNRPNPNPSPYLQKKIDTMLSYRQTQFCKLIATGSAHVAAALTAGFATTTAYSNSARLLANPAILARVELLRQNRLVTSNHSTYLRDAILADLDKCTDQKERISLYRELHRLIRLALHFPDLNLLPLPEDDLPTQNPEPRIPNTPTQPEADIEPAQPKITPPIHSTFTRQSTTQLADNQLETTTKEINPPLPSSQANTATKYAHSTTHAPVVHTFQLVQAGNGVGQTDIGADEGGGIGFSNG